MHTSVSLPDRRTCWWMNTTEGLMMRNEMPSMMIVLTIICDRFIKKEEIECHTHRPIIDLGHILQPVSHSIIVCAIGVHDGAIVYSHCMNTMYTTAGLRMNATNECLQFMTCCDRDSTTLDSKTTRFLNVVLFSRLFQRHTHKWLFSLSLFLLVRRTKTSKQTHLSQNMLMLR